MGIARSALRCRNARAIGGGSGGDERDKEHRHQRDDHEEEHNRRLYHFHLTASTQ